MHSEQRTDSLTYERTMGSNATLRRPPVTNGNEEVL